MRKKLLLGYGWETLIVYDFSVKEYQLLDRYTYQVILHFATFVDFLNYMIQPIQKKLPTGMNMEKSI